MRAKSLQLCPTLCNPMDLQPTRLLCPWGCSGRNSGVGCHFLLQGIFPTQGSNLGLLSLPALAGGFFTASAKGYVILMKVEKKSDRQLHTTATAVNSVVSDSVRLHPWDSPGKNTGVGCHFLLQCIKVKSESEVTQPCPTLRHPMDCSLPGSSVHGIFQARVLE